MDQVCNELSIDAHLQDKYAALQALLSLGKASVALEEYGFSRQIRVSEDFETRSLAAGYTIAQWLNDRLGGQDRTVQSLLRMRVSRAPYVEQLCQEQGVTELDDYHIDGIPCKGLALAALWNIPALSLSGHPLFSDFHVTISHDFIDSDDDAEKPQSEAHTIGLVRCEEDLAVHAERLTQRMQAPLQDGADILEHAPALLPYLDFSKTAEKQLEEFGANDLFFSRVRDILIVLNKAMANVALEQSTLFAVQGYRYTPSEGEIATSGKKGERHTFTFSDGTLRLCEAHIRLSHGSRIYFCPDESSRKVHVGHIGKHLPTKKF